jgi:hypothetical protein
MWETIERIVTDTAEFQKWGRKHLLHRLHNHRILLIYEIAFPEEKKRFTYSFSIGLVKGKHTERFQINIFIREQGELIHEAYIYLYEKFPLVKPSDIDKHLALFAYNYSGLAAEFDQLLKELKEDDDEGEDEPYIDPAKLN